MAGMVSMKTHLKGLLGFSVVFDPEFLLIVDIWHGVHKGSGSTLSSISCQAFAVYPASSVLVYLWDLPSDLAIFFLIWILSVVPGVWPVFGFIFITRYIRRYLLLWWRVHMTSNGVIFTVAPPSESQIPDPAVTSSDPDNDRLSVIRRTSGIFPAIPPQTWALPPRPITTLKSNDHNVNDTSARVCCSSFWVPDPRFSCDVKWSW